jgi:hypothetical protein
MHLLGIKRYGEMRFASTATRSADCVGVYFALLCIQAGAAREVS